MLVRTLVTSVFSNASDDFGSPVGSGKRARAARREHQLGPYRPVPRVRASPIDGDMAPAGLGSDIKQKRPVRGRCYLCREDADLQLSHVTPKWAYKAHKDEGAVLHQPEGRGFGNRMQDGYKHYMLCADCEQYTARGENALRQVAYEAPTELSGKGLRVDPIADYAWRVVGSNRHLIQRGLLAIALRYHWAPSGILRLPRAYVEPLRKAVLTDDYGWLAPPTGIKWYAFDSIEGVNPRAYTGVGLDGASPTAPARLLVEVGGIAWYMPATSGAWLVDAEFPSMDWVLMLGNGRANASWFPDFEAVDKGFVDEWRQYDLTRPCPCCLGKPASECCARGWASHAPHA